MTDHNDLARNELAKPLEDEHDPPGENQGIASRFSIEDVARGFKVSRDRIVRAFAGEFDLGESDTIDSRQAQHLSEVVLGDRTQEEQEAALMQLGAYTPRRDTIEPSVSEKAPGELADSRLAPDSRRRADVLDNEV